MRFGSIYKAPRALSLRVLTHGLSVLNAEGMSSVTHFGEVLMKVPLLVSESTGLLEPVLLASVLMILPNGYL